MSTISVKRLSREIAEVTFENLPVNLISPETVVDLYSTIEGLNEEPDVKVVIFTSSMDGYFYNHFNLSKFAEFPVDAGREHQPVWVKLILTLSKASFISIAQIRGRTRGGGNELALAMDLRYASIEKAFFGQPEVGTGVIPGGGGSERLPRFIGRDRALEVILSSNDYEALTAEKFGWITRAIPDQELDSFVLNIAERFAKFNKQALLAAKMQVNRATLPPDEDFRASYREFSRAMQWQHVPEYMTKLAAIAKQTGVEELEKNLGYHLGAGAGG